MTDRFNDKEIQKSDEHKSDDHHKDASSKFHDEVHEHRHCGGFKGLNLGIIKLGVEGHSLAFGVNVGIAKLDTKIGQETRVDAGVGLGPVGAKAGGGLGFDREGIHADAGAKGRITDEINTGASVGARVGPTTGAEAGMHAKLGDLFHTKQDASSSVGPDGFNNGYAGEVGVLRKFADVKTGAHANLNSDSSFGAGARARVEDASVGAGADITTRGNHILRPDVHVNADKGAAENRVDIGGQLGPTLDAGVDAGYSHANRARETHHDGRVSFGAGESGIGFKAVDDHNDEVHVHKLGLGRDYNSEKW